ncbi:hypothetical protein [Georgenia sp. Marseille-Q6866]
MRHVEDDTLTLVALGEVEPDAATAEHLATCEQCREELAALTAVVSAGRAAEPLVAPAPHVWDRIAQEIASTTADPAPPSAATAPAAAATTPARRGPGGSTRPPGGASARADAWPARRGSPPVSLPASPARSS